MEEPRRVDELQELLRRCHRAEVAALARRVGVNDAGMGLRDLSAHVARTLRRRGRHEGLNLLRRGEPSWREVLQDMARRRGVDPGGDVPELEERLAEWAVGRTWEALDERQRREVWRDAGLEGEPPADGHAALAVARRTLGRSFGPALGVTFLGAAVRSTAMLFPLLGPLAGCLTLWWLGRPQDRILFPAVLEVVHLRRALRHRVTVGVVGSPSSGKDAAIRAIFGVETGNVNPVAGSTREVAILRVEGSTALYVVNTPGLGDVVEAVTEEARQVLDHIDVYVYVVNAQGGVQARELADHGALARTGRPVLAVVNKIDTLRDADRERFLADARGRLRSAEEDFLPAAFDPLPQLAPAPLGVDEVRAWLARTLEAAGKDPAELPWLRPTSGTR